MDFPRDDLKWFGQGFDGFPKKLPDDVVEYTVHILTSTFSDVQIRERLQAFQRALNVLKQKFLKEYIWQRDTINVELTRKDGTWQLEGHSNYGDSVADEWLIVWLLRELSKEFKDAWIRIYDSDGEFLLIEAANALPKWLNPEVAENRVWINSHRLLIIPPGKGEDPAPLSLQHALTVLRDTPARPQQYLKVEKEAFHRLNNYPSAIAENQHHANIPLPRLAAHILHANPSYIAPIVEAFYLRDPISIRLLQPEKSKLPLILPPEDFVNVSIRFTKVLYAQLQGQHWNPPPPWSTAVEKLVNSSATSSEKVEVGIKVAAGTQMLLSHSLFADRRATREIKLLLEDLEAGDDALPTDAEITKWPQREDDERWLDIDFTEFEKELTGRGGEAGETGFGDKAAQENLKKMVERFNTFLEDDEADAEGGVMDDMDVDDDEEDGPEPRGWDDPEDSSGDEEEASDTKPSSTNSDSKGKGPTKLEAAISDDDSDTAAADAEFADYEAAHNKFITLSAAEKALLTDEARNLALAHDAEKDEDEEIQKLSEMMEAELFGHGALSLDAGKGKGKQTMKTVREDEGTVDGEDESEEDVLDEDYNLASNMLNAFKSQAGAAGPAGNMMRAMGVAFPRDADDALPKKGWGNSKK